MKFTAEYFIKALGMQPHVEGGWYAVTGGFGVNIPKDALPDGFTGGRMSASQIYYLLRQGEKSSWHILRGTEAWLWHCGGSLETTVGGSGDKPETNPQSQQTMRLGPRLEQGESLMTVIPAGRWQTTRLIDGDFALVSCIVTPAFHDDDFAFPKE